jgi:hypothetical protein
MSWLTDLFGGKSGKSKSVAPALKLPPTLKDVSEYPLYRQTLEDRMAGRGLGYDPSVLSSATAPYAKSQREGFQNYTMPTISGQASARGLGRSTIPVSQSRLGSQEVESDIANRVAQLTLANEQQKAAEKGTAIGQYGNLMGADYNSLMGLNAVENQAAVNNANVTNENRATNAQMNQNIGTFGINALLGTNNPVTTALNQIIPSGTNQATGRANQGMFGSGGIFGQKNAAAVNTGGLNAEELAMLKALLA